MTGVPWLAVRSREHIELCSRRRMQADWEEHRVAHCRAQLVYEDTDRAKNQITLDECIKFKEVVVYREAGGL